MTSRREGPVPLDHRRAPRPVGRGSDRRPRPGLQCEARRGSVGGRGPDAPPLLPPPRGNPGGPQAAPSRATGRSAGHASRRSDVLRIRKGRGGRRRLYSVRRCPDHPTRRRPWRNRFPKFPRHGETAWTLSGQHTGRTDLPLTERGERNASSLAGRLRGVDFARVFVSSLDLARRTSELAGFGAAAEVVPDLAEWDYGSYEGRQTAEIGAERPAWSCSATAPLGASRWPTSVPAAEQR